jgi:hypothetical protein
MRIFGIGRRKAPDTRTPPGGITIKVRPPGCQEWRQWATHYDEHYPGEAMVRVQAWVAQLAEGVEYKIIEGGSKL